MKKSLVVGISSAAILSAFALMGCKEGDRMSMPGGGEAVAITVTEEGFQPQEIHVKAGAPVVLAVTRKTDKTCAKELVLKEYDINQALPLNKTVQIRFTPRAAGNLTYACGMDMYKGSIVVE